MPTQTHHSTIARVECEPVENKGNAGVWEMRLDTEHRAKVVVTRKNIKNMYMRVKPSGVHSGSHIEISAPRRVPVRTIQEFIHSHSEWIIKAQAKQNSTYSSNNQEGILRNWTDERVQEAKKILEECLPRLQEKWSMRIEKQPTHITLRIMTSRWGSCTPVTGRIRLNLALAFMPEELLEYVYVHELTHLYERGHGEGFKRRMSVYLPDWKQRRRALNSYWI